MVHITLQCHPGPQNISKKFKKIRPYEGIMNHDCSHCSCLMVLSWQNRSGGTPNTQPTSCWPSNNQALLEARESAKDDPGALSFCETRVVFGQKPEVERSKSFMIPLV